MPPVPATVDVGIGVPLEQLPRTTMGAVVALDELLALARGEGDDARLRESWGEDVGARLGALLDEGLPWRLRHVRNSNRSTTRAPIRRSS